MRLVLHYLFAGFAAAAAVAYVYFGAVAANSLAPERPLGDRLTTLFTPSRRESDFAGEGWRAQRRQWAMIPTFFVFTILSGLLSAF